MAALFGHRDYWNASAKMVMDEFTRQLMQDSHGQATIVSIFYLLLSVITVAGNALVIVAVWKDPLKILRSSPSNFILLSLAMSDLTVGVLVIPGVALWYLRVGIKADPWLSELIVIIFVGAALIVSVGHVLLLTVDRYYALATPFKYRTKITKRRISIASVSIWICCVCYAVVSSIIQQHFLVMWFISVLVIYISSECICNLYLATLWYLMKHSKARTMIENSQSSVELFYQREKKVFKVIVSVIFVYFFCVIPWLVTQLVLYFCKVCHEHFEVMMVCYNVTTGFLFVNSALNPFLYSWRFSKFRATFKYFWRTFSQLKGRRKKTIKITERRQSFNTQL